MAPFVTVRDAADYRLGDDADALLSPENQSLDSEHGWASLVRREVGPAVRAELAERARERPALVLGEVFQSTAGRLPCEAILHAVVLEYAEQLRVSSFTAALVTSIERCLEQGWLALDVLVPERQARYRYGAFIDALESSARTALMQAVHGGLQVRFIVADSPLATKLKHFAHGLEPALTGGVPTAVESDPTDKSLAPRMDDASRSPPSPLGGVQESAGVTAFGQHSLVDRVASSRPPVVILHISDLHFGPHCRFRGFESAGLTELARRLAVSVKDALREHHIPEAVALVAVTGDIVESGEEEQYRDALAFFTSLRDALTLASERVLFVPGNHDVSWSFCELANAERKTRRISGDDFEGHLYQLKFTPYRDFLTTFYGGPVDELRCVEALDAGHTQACIYTYNDLFISVAALDSCERETHELHGGQLGKRQAQALMDYWQLNPKSYLRIVAIHHNPVADLPKNIAAWADKLTCTHDNGRLPIEHFLADATGFAGRERLERITRDRQISVVLHGHVHAAGLSMWAHGDGFDHTLVSAAGSWGLADEQRPESEPMSVQLLYLGEANRSSRRGPRIEAIRLRYEPRAHQTGFVEPGNFVLDSGNEARRDLPLSLPAHHPGFRRSKS